MQHLLPNLIAPVIVEATFGMAGAILAKQPQFFRVRRSTADSELGAHAQRRTSILLLAPHHTTFPGLAIMLVVLGFNFQAMDYEIIWM